LQRFCECRCAQLCTRVMVVGRRGDDDESGVRLIPSGESPHATTPRCTLSRQVVSDFEHQQSCDAHIAHFILQLDPMCKFAPRYCTLPRSISVISRARTHPHTSRGLLCTSNDMRRVLLFGGTATAIPVQRHSHRTLVCFVYIRILLLNRLLGCYSRVHS